MFPAVMRKNCEPGAFKTTEDAMERTLCIPNRFEISYAELRPRCRPVPPTPVLFGFRGYLDHKSGNTRWKIRSVMSFLMREIIYGVIYNLRVKFNLTSTLLVSQ